MTAPEDLTVANFGPLLALAGTWEGDQGLDVSFHHADDEVGDTPYFERVTFTTFGPVDNGSQALFGLDYRMAAWRMTELDQDPFHTEVGYWLYDPAEQQLMRSFMIPRGSTLIAGGTVAPDATSFEISAEMGSGSYGILSNRYLETNACCERYVCTITIGDDEWSYEEDSILRMKEFDDLFHHTDRNTLRRVADQG